MQDGYCFQLIEQGVTFPPILIKAELQAATAHGIPSSSQSNRFSALRLQAIRFLNGKQELVQLDLGGDEDNQDDFVKAVSGKKGLNKRLSKSECCEEVSERFKANNFTTEYDKDDHKLKIAFKDMKALDVTFDFVSEVKRSPATPAFVLAFEAACSFGRAIQIAEEQSSQASKELKLKARELTQAERKASNLSEDLTREKQKFQRLLSSGGSSVEDALAPRTGRGGRRNASLLTEGSVMAHDPDSPRKKRKAADGVLLKAGRTAQKETKVGFIDSSSDEEGEERLEANKRNRNEDKPSSSDTAASASAASKTSTGKDTKSLKSAGRQKAKLIKEPTLNAMRSMRSAKNTPKSGFVESEEEEAEEEEQVEAASNGGKSRSKRALKKKAATSDTETEKTETDSDTATVGKGTK